MIDSLILNPQSTSAGGADPNINDEAFLPRILSIFYATFDAHTGPRIVYQVPEGSIGVSQNPPDSATSMRSPSFSASSIRSPSLAFTPAGFASGAPGAIQDTLAGLGEPEPLSLGGTRAQSLASMTPSDDVSPAASQTDLSSPPGSSTGDRPPPSPLFGSAQPPSGLTQSRPPALGTSTNANKLSQAPLLEFDSISEYVIPKNKLCGRLVHCNTPRHRILGFPVVLNNPRYLRREFRYNLCFVFDRWADLSCYEPVVRKCAKVLLNCEASGTGSTHEESGFLSSPKTSHKMYSILEQLYEDLNSYSETSIRIDSFNSIELKIFPFYPNPPKVHDWQVPIALINLTKRVEPNWDLTMAKVVQYIDGVHHVRKIADLADTDIVLTRLCMEHLLFYQCVLMVDIFQYSNVYALKPAVQWLASDASVIAECGPYVTRPGHTQLPWPKLLQLYSRLKRGKTVHDWIEENDIANQGIDPRRFVSFGVIKGFVRRVHRYPILVPREKSSKKKRVGPGSQSRNWTAEEIEALFGAFKDSGLGTISSPQLDPTTVSASMESSSSLATVHGFRLPGRSVGVMTALDSHPSGSLSPPTTTGVTPTQYYPLTARPRQGSVQSTLSAVNTQHASQPYLASTTNITANNPSAADSAAMSSSWKSVMAIGGGQPPPTPMLTRTGSARNRTTSASRPVGAGIGPPGQTNAMATTISIGVSGSGVPGAIGSGRGTIVGMGTEPTLPYPEDLPALLDGTHHTDELCTKYSVGWEDLEIYLYAIGWGITSTTALAVAMSGAGVGVGLPPGLSGAGMQGPPGAPQLAQADVAVKLARSHMSATGKQLDLGRIKIIYR